MKPSVLFRYILLPAVVFAVGTMAGIEYAKRTYVSRDRKFIEGETIHERD